MKTTQEKIEIMLASERGEKIEFRRHISAMEWMVGDKPCRLWLPRVI